MQIITAPEQITTFEQPSIFLGGAITGAADWQITAARLLTPTFATCFNPRRPLGFASPDQPDYLQSYRQQVEWEHYYLLNSDVVLFWMPREAVAVTTRFEIGWWFGLNSTERKRPFVVGIEPGVVGEVYYHLVLPQIGLQVYPTLEATCQAAVKLAQNL